MRMTPTVIIVGILALLTAITLTVVYWPYATRNITPSDIFRPRSAVEEAGRKIYLAKRLRLLPQPVHPGN